MNINKATGINRHFAVDLASTPIKQDKVPAASVVDSQATQVEVKKHFAAQQISHTYGRNAAQVRHTQPAPTPVEPPPTVAGPRPQASVLDSGKPKLVAEPV